MIFDPPVFRIIVIEETDTYTNPLTFKEEMLTLYFAQALEWDIGSQGKTIDDSLLNIERLIFSQQCIYNEHPDTFRLKEAPEEWQRVRNIGKEMIRIRKDYRELYGEKHPIVCRKDLDMRNTKLKIVKNDN